MKGKILSRSLGVLVALLIASGSHGAVIITAVETGGDVVFSTSTGGSLNLTGLSCDNCNTTANPFMQPIGGPSLVMGAITPYLVDRYTGTTGPSSFGSSGAETVFQIGSGVDPYGILQGDVIVPKNYISGTPLDDATNTISSASFDSLGMAPGTYVWSWSGDSITLNIGSVVPLPGASWLFGSALGLLGWMRRKKA